jgi:hypothetical protein
VQNLLDPPQTLIGDAREWTKLEGHLERSRGVVALSRSDFEALVSAWPPYC